MNNYKVEARVLKDGQPIPFSYVFKAASAKEAEELAEAKFAMIHDDLVSEFADDDEDELSLQILDVTYVGQDETI